MKALVPITAVAPFDPVAEAQENLIAIVFPESRAYNFGLAVAIAKGGKYREVVLSGKTYHCAVFSQTQADVLHALSLLKAVMSVGRTQVFIRGHGSMNKRRVRDVLECYSRAIAVADTTAHCHVIRDLHLFPCRFLERFRATYPIHIHHSTPHDQLRAAGARHEVEWCPLFRPEDYRMIKKEDFEN